MPTEKCHGAAKKARWVRCSTVCLNLKLPDVSALLRTPSQTLLLALEYGRILGSRAHWLSCTVPLAHSPREAG